MIVEKDVVVVFGVSGIQTANEGDVLEIQLPKQDPTLSGFQLDKVNVLEGVGPLVALYFDDYTNPIVALIIGKMNLFFRMGLGQKQKEYQHYHSSKGRKIGVVWGTNQKRGKRKSKASSMDPSRRLLMGHFSKRGKTSTIVVF